MRRRTSAWIAGALGAGLTASIVLAQQMPGSGRAPRDGSGASDRSSSEPASLYGASGTRGARYLMRNGLDYLQYQQYERALKFLRDAEAREKELSAAERQELKRGIERAQNGLRAAADAATPYALSDRSRPGTGFTPARPEAQTALAARTGSTGSPAAPAGGTGGGTDPDAGAVANLNASRTATDDAPGEPIRLASNEPDAGAPTQPGGPGTQTIQGPTEVPVPDAGPPADPQSAKAEIPALAAPEIPSLTAVPPSTDAVGGAGTRPTTPRDGTSAAAAAPAGGAPAASTVQDPPAQDPPATATGTMAPAPIPADAAPAPILLETPDSAKNPSAPATTPGSATAPAPSVPEASAPAPSAAPPLSSPEASAPAPAPASDPAATGASTPAPDTGGLVPAAANGPAAPAVDSGSTAPQPVPMAATNPAAGEPDTAPLPPLGTDAARAAETSGPPHRESEEPAGAEAPGATSPGVAGGPDPNPTSTPGVEELPPLPGDLGRGGGAAGASPATGEATPAGPSIAPAASPDQTSASPAADATATPAPTPTASSEDTTKAEPTRPAVAPEAPAGPTSTPAVEESLPPLPDALAAGSPPGTAIAPAPEATAAPAGEPGSSAPDGPAASAPAAVANGAAASPAPVNDAVGSAGPAGAADERPIPVPQPDAATPAETAPGSAPTAAPAAAPAPTAVATDGPAPTRMSGSPEASFFPAPRDKPRSRLSPDQDRRVAELMARQERDDIIRNQAQARPQPEGVLPREGSTSNLQTQTQYDISRAPSPAEARPIKAIPVPEDWVPLAARNWSPQRKYWAAAATCHLPLYFQDAALERYGHPVEQFVGPVGRYLSYPVDDPKQSNQRNQIIQPFFSWGLFALQIAAWPYNGIMDPPWEAQYDLGYYRPGDMVPTDVYWLPLHGYGPPLHGNRY